MSSLRYVGALGTTDQDILTKLEVDTAFANAGGVDLATLQQRADSAVVNLATKVYADNQDGQYVTSAYVDTQDQYGILATAKGAANGVASLDASSRIPASQIAASDVPRSKVVGPYMFQKAATIETARQDADGTKWDKFIGSITFPAPGGSGLWRPYCHGRFEVWNGGNGSGDGVVGGRAAVYAIPSGASYQLFRAEGRNGGSNQPYGVQLRPNADTDDQRPGGWAATSGMTLNFFLTEVFAGWDCGLAGANEVVGYAVRI